MGFRVKTRIQQWKHVLPTFRADWPYIVIDFLILWFLVELGIYTIYIDYVIESATYRFLFTSCKTLENERVSAANE